MPRIRTGEEAVLKIVELNGFQSSNLWRGANNVNLISNQIYIIIIIEIVKKARKP